MAGHLAAAEVVVASDLTLLECDRALRKLEHEGVDTTEARARLDGAVRRWVIAEVGRAAFRYAARSFPVEPVRSLDALHLATAAAVLAFEPNAFVLTLDRRVHTNATALGWRVLPATV